MTFSSRIRPLVRKVGGTSRAAKIIGMSPQIVRAWLRGDVKPSRATREGALLLLRSSPNTRGQTPGT